MPHLLTVEGFAYNKSYTSNIIVMVGFNLIIFELLRHNFLLSSRTVFIF